MEYYGLENSAVELLKSYLHNRYQKVSCNGKESEFLNVPHGVPQGSILGPLLFIIYINDLPCVVGPSAKGYLFADDFVVCTSNNQYDVPYNITMEVEDWCNANLLCLNRDKIDDLKVCLRVSNSELEHVNFLGFTLDSKLSWNKHIDKISNKMSKGAFMLRKLRTVVGLKVLKLVYFAHIHSHLSYGALLWGNQKYSIKLFRIQKKAVRLMCGLPQRSNCINSFKDLQIMTLPNLFVFQCVLYIKENYSQYTEHGTCHEYYTRGRDNLMVTYCRLAKTHKSFTNISVKLFNSIPFEIRKLPMNKFELTMKQFMLDNPIYKIYEFYEKCVLIRPI